MSGQDYLLEMTKVARAAGGLAMEYGKDLASLEVSFKGQADLLCAADGAVETLIRDRLAKSWPRIAFEGEEHGRQGPGNAKLIWNVDPIDGTTNFLSSLHFAISIALVRAGTPIAGVIYDPVANEMFAAAQSQGASLNSRPIKVRRQEDPARFVVGTGLALDEHAFSHGAYERLHQIREQVAAVRITGSCALLLAHVACGRLDGYFEGPTGVLDFAAGLLLVREAGGITTDFWGRQNFNDNVTTTVGAPACQQFLCRYTSQSRET